MLCVSQSSTYLMCTKVSCHAYLLSHKNLLQNDNSSLFYLCYAWVPGGISGEGVFQLL